MLWEKIAKKDKEFGHPGVFIDNIDLQKWYSFTATLKDTTFHNYMENFSRNVDGTGGLCKVAAPYAFRSEFRKLRSHPCDCRIHPCN